MSKRSLDENDCSDFIQQLQKFQYDREKKYTISSVQVPIKEFKKSKESLGSSTGEESKCDTKSISNNTTTIVKSDNIDPFVAPFPAKYREKFSSPCFNCFKKSCICHHIKEDRLVLLIIGHNPSDHAWQSGNMYSHPSNRMWKLLTGNFYNGGGVIPSSLTIDTQNSLPQKYKIGFVDIDVSHGNKADSILMSTLENERNTFYSRLYNHLLRICRDQQYPQDYDITLCEPRIVLFAGKRQYLSLLTPKERKNVKNGLQEKRPINFPYKTSKIYVCSSTSGLVGIKKEELFEQYEQDYKGQALAEKLYFIILILFSVVGFFVGLAMDSFYYSFLIWATGLAISFIVCVIDWPMYNKNPVAWRKIDAKTD
ncbi:hypothetical protein WA158_005241 [Blastocystis sp. Blastoise]